MDDQNKNLILATVLSFIVVLVWFLLFPPQEQAPVTDGSVEQTQVESVGTDGAMSPAGTTAAAADTPAIDAGPAAEAPRIRIETPSLEGSISLAGGRIDDLQLTDYKVSLDEDSADVTLFRPQGEPGGYYALYGWVGGTNIDAVPGADTVWSLESGDVLTPETPVTLAWDNGAGQIFRQTYAVDDKFMFTVSQSIENTGEATVALRPYGLLRRHGEPADLQNFFVVHEGLVRMSDGELEEQGYDDMVDFDVDPREGTPAERIDVSESGWVGFTEHYWMATLIPGDRPFRSTAKYYPSPDVYQTEAVLSGVEATPGETIEITTQLFAGAKEGETIKDYEDAGVTRFFDSIDWGWFFFLTKPIFWLIHWLHSFIGNMGWSIIAMTIFLKALLFPLAYKSYASMAKMKELQPRMEELKAKAGDDRQKLQKEMMELYKKEKVNPAAGCLPILLQIPIFFSLYKVIFVTLELRHEAWVGWIKDLSAPDPTSIVNLFGALPWDAFPPESFLAILNLGVLPILLGISMWLQQKLNPAPADPAQQMIFAWMPWVFMFMLGNFASGLVLYWITNNTITFIQQYLIMRSHGFKPDVFGNIRKSFSRKTAAATKGKD
ncbi:protein translocase subunit yidC [Pseudooceanicola antarcticus]|uniref:Membrane protein insertase YidC n=1 Tax=Pseudooceanicola antarcticus TaxID=1247613 RepID=A0A285IQP0_9RHOB|nr:membrane protein insertase YidC [Pseudooceanicola antarcticus]PJE31749.1 membrane protein insertase YidC [Pseudooceanicola antarcticus]SNY50340.1 protein translocase subunit yidC [Pseudooceanicola antarcticus]